MDLLGALRKLGDRLGILEMSREAQPPSAPVKIQTRTVTLAELIMTIRVTEVQSLAELPSELSISFDDVFKAAGISAPPGGWTVDKLMEFVSNDPIRELDRSEAQRETLRRLAADHVDPADVIKDAISRDKALDAFADSIFEKRQRWVAEMRQEIREIEKQIADEQEKWNQWRRKKRQREQDMARAIGYLIDTPVISIDDE